MRGGCLWLGILLACAPAAAQERCVLRAELDGIISWGATDYLQDAVRATEKRGCQALLVALDTPGGYLDATRELTRSLLNAPVPVIVYVSPAGAHAGSAGVFVTMAAHVAAMAPGTNIGAAHPVTVGGGRPDEHIAEKIENDTAAFARAVAQQRGRNVEWAEAAVRESRSATATEAVELDVVDLVAESERELLSTVDGREVAEKTVHTDGARVETFSPTIQQLALIVLGDPNIAYVLLMIGFLGLMMETYSPGLIVPGVVGALCLLVAAVGMNMLPVQAGGVVLLALAVGLFIAELHVASYGLLTLGGLVALVLGSALLFDTRDPEFFAEPSVRISWALIVPLATVLTGAAALLAWRAGTLRKRAHATGHEALVGMRGRADGPVDRDGGRVRVHGELWHAVSEEPIEHGAQVEVVAVSGLRLDVIEIEERT